MQNANAMYGWTLFLLAVSQIIFIEADTGCVYNVTNPFTYLETDHIFCEYSMLYNPNGYNVEASYGNIYNKNVHLRRLVRVYCDITSSQISEITQNTLIGVESVFSLVIKNASVSEIAPDALINFTELNELNLSNNNLIEIRSGSFYGIRNLTRLYLAYNHIKSMEELVKVGSLMYLNVSFNAITTLNNVSFGRLRHLSEIDLSNNRINAMDLTTFNTLNGDGLKHLYLSNNSILDIGELRLPSLEKLFLAKNKIQTLKTGVFTNMRKLRYLDISGNMLTSLSIGTFSGLTSLRWLSVDHNRISTISGYPFNNTPNLEELQIRGNALTDLDVSQLTNASKIYLEGNNFTCSVLAGIVVALRPASGVLAVGNHFDSVNINGIRCEEDEATTNSATVRNGLFKDNFQTDAAAKPAISELLDLFRNVTRENKAGMEAMAENTSKNSKLLERLLADGEEKRSMLVNRSEPRETEDLERLLSRIEAIVSDERAKDKEERAKEKDERAKDKQYQDRLIDLMKQNTNNLHTLAVIGGMPMLGVFIIITIYIFIKWNSQERNANKETSARELNPIM